METLSRRLHQCPSGRMARGTPFHYADGAYVARYREVNVLSAVDAAHVGGLVDGEGTITLSRKHASECRQLVISISNTEQAMLEFVRDRIGAGKITSKRVAKAHHTPSLTFAIWNRQALALLLQIQPFLRSYKRRRADLIQRDYLRLTPRNGKYSSAALIARQRFEAQVLALRANNGRPPIRVGNRGAVMVLAPAPE